MKLTADDGMEGNGSAIATSGNTLVAGAYSNNDESAYIFVRDNDGNWTEQAKLVPSDSEIGDRFGSAVAVSGDTVVVGAPWNANGSVYVFERTGDIWTEKTKLTTDEITTDSFGTSVDIKGDVIVVGDPIDTHAGTRSGAAYVFMRDNSGNWTEQARLTASDATEFATFGISVATDGNVIIVGADEDEVTAGNRSGAAYIFTQNGNDGWIQQTKLIPSDGEFGDFFGASVAIQGSFVIVGARYKNSVGLSSGAAYIFMKDNSDNWTQQTKLVPSEPSDWADFGGSVSLDEDTAIVGASGSKAAYVFLRGSNNGWTQQSKLLPIEEQSTYGLSVVIEGDTAFVGASLNDVGSVIVYNRDESGKWPTDVFVTSVLDANGDGIVSPSDATYVINRIGADAALNPDADINGDNTINEDDLNLVIDALGTNVSAGE